MGLAFFGSFARQQMFKTSDKDLLIVLGSRLPIKRDLYLIWEQHFSKDFPSISPHFTHLPDRKIPLGSLWLEVALEGQIVFEKNQQLSSCLMEIRRDIARGLYQRKQTYGHPYWLKAILKEGTDK